MYCDLAAYNTTMLDKTLAWCLELLLQLQYHCSFVEKKDWFRILENMKAYINGCPHTPTNATKINVSTGGSLKCCFCIRYHSQLSWEQSKRWLKPTFNSPYDFISDSSICLISKTEASIQVLKVKHVKNSRNGIEKQQLDP